MNMFQKFNIKISYLASDAVRKYHRPGCLNNKHVFFTVLETKKSKIKLLAYLVPGENPLLDLQKAAFSHVFTRPLERALVSLPCHIWTLIPL